MLGPMTALAGLHHVALTVADLDASIAWYRDVLGLEEEFRHEPDGRRTAVLRFPGHPDTLGLVEHTGAEPGFDPRRVGLDHVAFVVGSGDELRAWARRLDERGVTNSGPIDIPPGGMLHFTDPDGIALAVFWDRSSADTGS